MTFLCNLCKSDGKKTDRLKLVNINGRDYLICQSCITLGEYNVPKQNGKGLISRVQATN